MTPSRVGSGVVRVVTFVFAVTVIVAPQVKTLDAGAAPDPSTSTTTTTTPPGSPLSPDAPRVAIELERDSRGLDRAASQLAELDAKLSSTDQALSSLNGQILANQVALDSVKTRIRSRVVAVYTRGSSATSALLDVGASSNLLAAEQYSAAAFSIDTRQLAALTETEQTLESDRADRQHQDDDLTASRAQVVGSIGALTQQRDGDQHQLDAWGAVPVMGDSALTASELADWYRSTGAAPLLAPGTTIDDIARLYIVEGRAEHVRGDLAFAQAIVETGSFHVAAGNNYSGIGVCDSCQGGYGFPTPLDGVRAQIQLLRNYADPDSRAALLANVPSPALYGSDVTKASVTYNSFFLKGKAPLWNQMGNGNWATSTTYANTVIDTYNRIVQFAAAHPS